MNKNSLVAKRAECSECDLFKLCGPLRLGDSGIDIDLNDQLVKRRVEVKRGNLLFRNGDPHRSIYAISSGSFKLTTPADQSLDRIVDFRFPGELLGMSGIHAGNYCSNALAMEDCTVCEFSFDRFSKLGIQIPILQQRIIHLMSEALAHRQRMTLLLTGLKNAEERLAAFLLGISLRFKEHGFPAQRFKLVMDRSDIGNFLGLAKETVSRILVSLQRDGILQLSGKNIAIDNLDELANRAQATPCALAKISQREKI
jgi:CRP/FNR family transcriptional regulator, anaerobic regulatory protein